MGGQTTLAFWQLLLVALGPATLAAAVAIFSPILLEGRKQATETRKKRAEKLEELIRCLYEYDHWLDERKNERVFGSHNSARVTPLSQVQSIIYIYFPDLQERAAELYQQALVYEKWMIKVGGLRVQNNDINTDGFNEVYEPYLRIFRKLLSEITTVGQTEFRSAKSSWWSKFIRRFSIK